MKLTLVMPTRHRASLAVTAIESILARRDDPVDLIVSDNSSADSEVRQVEGYCRSSGDPRLTYLRPPSALPMPTHWNWALEEALARTGASHIGITYDRKRWNSGALGALLDACARAPDVLLTYVCDFTYPTPSGVAAWLMPATGKLYEIRADRIVASVSRGMIDEMGQAFPLLSNCIVPRQIMDRVRQRFGDLCDSSTPDTAFTFRFCAVEQRYRHFDRPAAVIYGFKYSNGAALFRGESGGTWADFASLWGDRSWTSDAPIPHVRHGQNVTFHEYNRVRKAAGDLFPPIEQEGYLRALARTLDYLDDPGQKAEIRALLEQHGWSAESTPAAPIHLRTWRALGRISRPLRLRARGLLQGHLKPVNGAIFPSDEEAVQSLLDHQLPVARRNVYLDHLQAVECADVL
jgi:glycosyltransferase involved in cell wall biosynthesis